MSSRSPAVARERSARALEAPPPPFPAQPERPPSPAALAGLPQIRAAVLSSEISWSVARRAVAHASPETDEAFAAALRGRTVCAAEAMLRAAFPDAPKTESDPVERAASACLSPRAARRWVRMARLGPASSAVANVFRAGLLTPKQACLVSESVPPAQQPDAIAFAQGVTLRRFEDALGAPGTAHDAITFTAPPEAANVFLMALEAARLHLEAGKKARQTPPPSHAAALLRRSIRPGWAPVCTPSRTTQTPFTSTWTMPAGATSGFSKLEEAIEQTLDDGCSHP